MGLVWVGPLPATSLPFLWHLLGSFIPCSQAWRSEIKFTRQAVGGGEDLHHAELLGTTSSALPAEANEQTMPALGLLLSGKSARDRNLFSETTLKMSCSLSPSLSLWYFLSKEPNTGAPCPAPPLGNREAHLPALPSQQVAGRDTRKRNTAIPGEICPKKHI